VERCLPGIPWGQVRARRATRYVWELGGKTDDRLAVVELMLKWVQVLQLETARGIGMGRLGDSTGRGFEMEFDGWIG